MKKTYDFLIVGAGLAGATFARIMSDNGAKCLVIDRRTNVAGNVYSEPVDGIEVHRYGAHIFHTDNEKVWKFVNRFTPFFHYVHAPVANYKGTIYNLPFNMNTFYQLWGTRTPKEAADKIAAQVKEAGIEEPSNLEEQAIRLVGKDVYAKLIKGYTEKQWGRSCDKLPPSIIKRIPVRFTYDNSYFQQAYQGIPKCGYTKMVERMLQGIEVKLNEDFLQDESAYRDLAERIFYTGPVDELYRYEYGALEYRSLRFETETLEIGNYQGVSVMNYTDSETPYTRIIEHKHFCASCPVSDVTVITREYPADWAAGSEPYYPVNDASNSGLYQQYREKARVDRQIVLGGRLGTYRYLDMDQVIADSLDMAENLLAHRENGMG